MNTILCLCFQLWLSQVLFVAKEHACPLRDYMEAECKNLVGLVNRMKDRWAAIKKGVPVKNKRLTEPHGL
jgi:hypothetical protein